MVGERTGARFRLGDRLTVKVARVDLETSKIDFSLISHSSHLKTGALGANIHAPSGDVHKRTLNASRDKVSTDFKPLSTRALDKAKHDRSGKKIAKAPAKVKHKSHSKSKGKR
jgi:ribonuclease R